MKKLFIIIIILLGITFSLWAANIEVGLREETKASIEALKTKHYGLFFQDITSDFGFICDYEWSMTFKDGKLFVETQDGKWFIEMKEVEENDKTKNK